MGSGLTASNLANLQIRTGLFVLNNSGLYTSSPLSDATETGSSDNSCDIYDLNGLSNNTYSSKNTLNLMNALYSTYTKYSSSASRSSLAKFTASLFGKESMGFSLAYAKYQQSAQRLGLTNSSFNLYGVISASLAAKNINKAGTLSYSLF